MIVIMSPGAEEEDVQQVIAKVEEAGLEVHLSRGVEHTLVGLVGDTRQLTVEELEVLPGVQRAMRIMQPFKLVSREFRVERTVVDVGGVKVGAKEPVFMAGPCAVEDRESLFETAEAVADCGAQILRGGAFKPRTSPYSFQGLGQEGLRLLAQARERTGLKIVTEVMSAGDVEMVSQVADILQVGARNMQNYSLLRAVGSADRPVLLKRGMMSSVQEWLMAAEYIVSEGNTQVILCERGIRTFEKYTRNTLDLSSIPLVKKLSHLPVVADPSHSTGRRDLVVPMAEAAIAAGADGLLVEVHPRPEQALCDGAQSLTLEGFARLVDRVGAISSAKMTVVAADDGGS